MHSAAEISIPHRDDAPIEQSTVTVVNASSVENREASEDGRMSLEDTYATPTADFADLGGDDFHWNVPEIDFDDFVDPQMMGETAVDIASSSSSSGPVPMALNSRLLQAQLSVISPASSIPASPSLLFRSLNKRPKLKIESQRIADLMVHNLKSYPLMVLRHKTLPPFIHPHLLSSEAENDHTEPLTNCISLVHMLGSGVQGSRKLFWKNVRLECEHLYAEASCDDPERKLIRS